MVVVWCGAVYKSNRLSGAGSSLIIITYSLLCDIRVCVCVCGGGGGGD